MIIRVIHDMNATDSPMVMHAKNPTPAICAAKDEKIPTAAQAPVLGFRFLGSILIRLACSLTIRDTARDVNGKGHPFLSAWIR
jgi:hypothetical protein